MQIAQVFGGFLPALYGTTGLKNTLQLDQRRRAALTLGHGALPRAVGAAQAQCAHAAEVIYRQQVVQLGQGGQLRVAATALGVITGDDAPPPCIGCRVGHRAMKHRVVRAGRLVRLIARHQLQIGRDTEARSTVQPGCVIGKSAVLTPPLPGIHQRTQRQSRLAHADGNLLAHGRGLHHHNAPVGV